MISCRRLVLAWMMLLLASTAHARTMNAEGPPTGPQRLWRLAEQEQAAIEQRGILLDDASLAGYLQAVVGRLWKQVHTDLSPLTVRVIADERLEAYTYPNGYCFLTTGILTRIENEDQLAMIIAHEIVHYVRQHTAALYDHFHAGPTGTGSPYTDLQREANTEAIEKKLNAAEYQADREGLYILMGAGYCGLQALSLAAGLKDSMQSHGHPETAQKMEKRIALMKSVLERNPGGSSCGTTADGHESYLNRIAPALLANAQTALQSGDWGRADRSVSVFLDMKPEDARAYYLKGEILRRRNDGGGKDHYVRYYEKALQIDPQFPSAHLALGELNFKAGRYQAARMHFEAFLNLAPKDDASEYVKGYLRRCRQ